jgi:hypothetical protein
MFNGFKEKQVWYQNIGKCYCSILNEDVFFNSRGFRHIIRNGLGRVRSKKEIENRLRVLPLVPMVLEISSRIVEYRNIDEI